MESTTADEIDTDALDRSIRKVEGEMHLEALVILAAILFLVGLMFEVLAFLVMTYLYFSSK